ncbi:MAG: hypothetical protein AAF573_16020 [Bacteroidota bacterium]
MIKINFNGYLLYSILGFSVIAYLDSKQGGAGRSLYQITSKFASKVPC